MDGILFSLFNHTNEAIDKKDYGTLEENISLLKDIFEAILQIVSRILIQKYLIQLLSI